MILMLSCSYKPKAGNTRYYLELLKNELAEKDVEIVELRQVLNGGFAAFTEKLERAEAFVMGAPLYVDGLPAQAVKLLEMLLQYDAGRYAGKKVYVVSNLGFYEGEQTCNLFDIVRNWCERMQMVYGGGLTVGAGPMICVLKNLPLKKGLNGDIGRGIALLAEKIAHNEAMGNYCAKTKIPRAVYRMAAHMTFRKTLKKNGLNQNGR